jgi:hypothetical protein
MLHPLTVLICAHVRLGYMHNNSWHRERLEKLDENMHFLSYWHDIDQTPLSLVDCQLMRDRRRQHRDGKVLGKASGNTR